MRIFHACVLLALLGSLLFSPQVHATGLLDAAIKVSNEATDGLPLLKKVISDPGVTSPKFEITGHAGEPSISARLPTIQAIHQPVPVPTRAKQDWTEYFAQRLEQIEPLQAKLWTQEELKAEAAVLDAASQERQNPQAIKSLLGSVVKARTNRMYHSPPGAMLDPDQRSFRLHTIREYLEIVASDRLTPTPTAERMEATLQTAKDIIEGEQRFQSLLVAVLKGKGPTGSQVRKLLSAERIESLKSLARYRADDLTATRRKYEEVVQKAEQQFPGVGLPKKAILEGWRTERFD